MNALEASNSLFKLVQDIQNGYEKTCSDLAYYDAEYNDLTHAFELVEFDKEKGYQLALLLQQNRKARREAKKERERLQPLYDFLRRQKEFTGDLPRVTAKVHRVAERQRNRTYSPRVHANIFEAEEKPFCSISVIPACYEGDKNEH
ncbi:hypothetical protein QYF50_15440 [Paenibacillus vini]|uniref:hypothetical protein n=1 Tax=Paenibacillus vini TaxID=1476024 RepID=UPI0025B6CACE|nr:hypothetical protein [Paenibacillus vini]MDN4069245.1 hypothetical protein [Paenibacillus vini]MDN4069298.1 hypothetical protein [Paenibacillus vini]